MRDAATRNGYHANQVYAVSIDTVQDTPKKFKRHATFKVENPANSPLASLSEHLLPAFVTTTPTR
jgi:hypothetical protein